MTNHIVRVSFVGAGDHMVRAHTKHLKKHPGVQIVGCFDPSEDSFEALKEELGGVAAIVHYSSYEALLEDAAVDAFMIGSPDKYHLPQLKQAVEAGKHVFCEKPMCSTVKDIEVLIDILAEAQAVGRIVTSCHPRRFDPPYVWPKENMAHLTDRYGRPVEVKLDFTYHKPSKTGLHGGSMLQDHMNHEFDYMNFIFGQSDAIAHKLLDEEDRYHVSGVRDDGIVFSFGGTRRLNNSSYAETIDIRFERATLHIDTYNQANSYIAEHEKPKQSLLPITPGITDYDVRFKGINDNWISAIQGVGRNYLTDREMVANSYMSVAFARQNSVSCDF